MSDLKSFIEQRRAAATTRTEVNWEKRREKWLSELKALFDGVESQLRAAGLNDGDFRRTVHKLNEETLGRYDAPELWIKLPGAAEIGFVPVASVIVGGYGRVDVVTKLGPRKVMLIADDADQGNENADDSRPAHERTWVWLVYQTRGIRGSYALDAEGLTRLLSYMTE